VNWRRVSFGVVLFALTAVWSLMTPLFSGPDEPSNFVRSAAVVRGEWVGDNVLPAPLKSYWTTTVNIDPQFGAANNIPWCFAPFSDRPGCGSRLEDTQVTDIPTWTNMGRYPIASFFISGIGTVFGAQDLSVRAARLMMSLACALLIALSVAAMKRRAASSVGVLMATLPGTVFLASTMNPSALEICAAIALWTIMPSVIAYDRTRFNAFVFGVAGALLILTRAIGPVLYVLIVALSYVATKQRRPLMVIAPQFRNALAIHGVAVLFAGWWYLKIYSFQTNNVLSEGIPSISLRSQIDEAVRHIPMLLDQAVGNFGWLDAPMPRVALYVIVALYCVVLARGIVVSSAGARIAMIALCLVTILVVIILDVNYYSMLRAFGAQGRHIVPLLVGLPIIAASSFAWQRNWEIAAGGIWGLVMVWAGLGALRRYTVGINGGNAMDMFTDRAWNPVLGFWPTVSMLILATLAVVCLFPYSRPSAE
jgi:hypothetical protein